MSKNLNIHLFISEQLVLYNVHLFLVFDVFSGLHGVKRILNNLFHVKGFNITS